MRTQHVQYFVHAGLAMPSHVGTALSSGLVALVVSLSIPSHLEAATISVGVALLLLAIGLIGATLHGQVAVSFSGGALHIKRRCLIGPRQIRAHEVVSMRPALLGGVVLRDERGRRYVVPERLAEVSGFVDAFSSWITGSLPPLAHHRPLAALPSPSIAVAA